MKTTKRSPGSRMGFPALRLLAHALLTVWLLCAGMAHAQDPAQYGTPFSGVPDTRDAVIYQVNMRAFSSSHNLQGVINRLDQIKALGTNVIYLMPVYPVGTLNAVNSPYCIKDFQSVGSEFGSLTNLRALVDGAHSRGMAVMLDWVVNQTSWDHPWITQHPDWYLHDGNGNITSLNGWTDVAALNFASTSMRTAMINAMRSWVFNANVDGFRCDFADNPPLDFWQQAISSLRGITTHKLLLLAEGTRAANYTAGFDYNFGMQFYYNSLKPIFTGGAATAIDNSNNVEYASATGNQQITRYLTNHDVNGAEGTPLELFGGKTGSMAAFVVAAYMKGVPFIYNGQEVAFPTRITFPFTSVTIDWSINPDVTAEYTKVIAFRNSSTALRRGTLVSYTNNDICVFTKTSGTEKVLVFSNLRNASNNFTLPAALANSTWKDAYSGATVTLGASVALSAYQYKVLTNANVPVVPVTGVTVSPTSASISAGTTRQLTATVAPANATNTTVSWSSSNNSIATVNASGLVTAVAAGTATITATTQDGNKTAAAAITVTAATSFTVNFYKPSNWGTGIKIYWWSALPAGVLADGTWPGVNMTNAGNGWYSYTFTNITSTNLIFNDGTNQTADLNRNKTGWYLNNTWYDTNPGTPVAVTGVSVSPTTATVNAGATQQLTATVSPSNATNKTVSWSSSNAAVATVNSSGLVTAVAGGTAVITVTTQDGNKTATSTITVPSTGTVYYQIKNRWQPTQFLYDGGNGQVKYGTNPSSANNLYQWAKVDAGSGYILLQNRSTGNYMHVENQNGAVQCSGITPGWYSAMWTVAAATDGWSYLQNRWQPSEWIHVEGQLGYAQYSGVQSGWYSAMWQFINPQTGQAARTGGTVQQSTEVAVTAAKAALTAHAIKVYPNPAAGNQFYIDVQGIPQNGQATVSVWDVNGRMVLLKKISGIARIEHHLAAGMYVVKIQSASVQHTANLIITK
ncbi:Ig-like domain-containing protein [Deminuibacter soli]|uniref:T9SS C-terminal target domain-containing protein n=1 Tax=Deminuibacter soli TaxID=2291815 RepID=A0A3E1NGI6_9BACT|nr:Ig-like domain-containing protein [Deminuibacter soli]RFM27059.1 T9SS C-terminal target domain-containing protein [Deminuibacter soli]